MARLVAETHELLIKNQRFLVMLGANLQAAGQLDAVAVSKIAEAHGITAEVKAEGYLRVPGYQSILSDALTAAPPA